MSPQPAPETSGHILPLRPDSPARQEPLAKASRRPFGTVQRQRSGRYQAVYKVKGERYIAPVTFFTKGDANAWLSLRQAEILEHRWKPDPRRSPNTSPSPTTRPHGWRDANSARSPWPSTAECWTGGSLL